MRNIYVSGCHCFLKHTHTCFKFRWNDYVYIFFFRYSNEYLKISFLRFSFKVVKMQKHIIRFSLPTDYLYESTMLFTYWPHAWFVNCFIVFEYHHNWLICQNLEECVAYNLRFTSSKNSNKLTTKCIPQINIKSQCSRVMTQS